MSTAFSSNKPRRHILFIITQGHWGGAQRAVFDLAAHLPETFAITVAVGDPDGASDLQSRLTAMPRIRLVQLTHLQRAIHPHADILAVRQLARLYRDIQPDIVHLHSSKAGIVGSLAARLLKKNKPLVVYTAHGWVFDEPLGTTRRSLYRFLERITAKDKHAVITVSEKDRKTAKSALRIPDAKLAVISPGISIPPYLPLLDARKQLFGSPETPLPVIGTIANFYHTKGLDILLKALALLRARGAETIACIIGDGPLRKNLEDLRSKLSLHESVIFTGFLPEAKNLIKAFDLFVLPSRKEGFPYTLLEAMNAEVPIIATDVGGNKELITNKKTGWLTPPENPEQLADTIALALSSLAQAKTMAEQLLKENQHRYTLAAMITATSALYSSLLSHESAQSPEDHRH